MARDHNTPRLAKLWSSLPGISQDITAEGTTGLAILNFTSPTTIMRMLGEYTLSFEAAETIAAKDDVGLTIGIGVVSSDAAAAGSASLPDPAGEPEYPWMYWASHKLYAMEATALQRNGVPGVGRWSFDIRSMRKMKPRESLVSVIQYADLGGLPPVHVGFSQTRVLLGIH